MPWVFETVDKTFTNFQHITVEEKEIISDQVIVVSKLTRYNELFIEFQKSYGEYLNIISGTDIGNNNDIARYIKNYLGSYKSYIDGMETVLSRSFDNQIYKSFKDLQKEAYDNNFSYRFIYNLRNYSQHCGTPISSIERVVNQDTKITLEVDRFLSEHTGMQKGFRKELENFSHDILDVGSAIKSVNDIIIDIQNKIINLLMECEKSEILKSTYNLMKFYNKNSKNNGVLYITNDSDVDALKSLKRDEPVVANIKITQVPHQLAIFILESISIEYILKGKNIGKSQDLPQIYKAKSAIEVPQFITGGDIVYYDGIKWIRVMESMGFAFEDGYDRYATIYLPHGLGMSSYDKIGDRFKEKVKHLFKTT